jgi:hypothetical protein
MEKITMIDYNHNPADTDYWNGVDRPVRLREEPQISFNDVVFSSLELRAFVLYVMNHGVDSTHADMICEGWERESAARLMRDAVRIAREIWG